MERDGAKIEKALGFCNPEDRTPNGITGSLIPFGRINRDCSKSQRICLGVFEPAGLDEGVHFFSRGELFDRDAEVLVGIFAVC